MNVKLIIVTLVFMSSFTCLAQAQGHERDLLGEDIVPEGADLEPEAEKKIKDKMYLLVDVNAWLQGRASVGIAYNSPDKYFTLIAEAGMTFKGLYASDWLIISSNTMFQDEYYYTLWGINNIYDDFTFMRYKRQSVPGIHTGLTFRYNYQSPDNFHTYVFAGGRFDRYRYNAYMPDENAQNTSRSFRDIIYSKENKFKEHSNKIRIILGGGLQTGRLLNDRLVIGVQASLAKLWVRNLQMDMGYDEFGVARVKPLDVFYTGLVFDIGINVGYYIW